MLRMSAEFSRSPTMLLRNISGSLQNRKLSTERFFIRNAELPVCSNCLHFIEYTNTNPFEGYRCKKFGEMNVTTGVIKYDLAAVCRLHDDMCGKKGLHYTAKNQTPSTITCGNTEFITQGV